MSARAEGIGGGLTMSMSHENERPSASTLEIAVFERACSWIVEVQDEDGARRVPLTSARVVVGSARGADLVVRDPAVSAQHCVIGVLGSGIAVQDLESKNGTFVGSARVMQAWASAGTTITIGRATLALFEAGMDEPEGEALGPSLPGIAGGSARMRRVGQQVRRLAKHSAPVLIAGESGTGKELIARALHHEGPRALGPFVVINVAALPRELVESEMFGHERGAFTGAVSRREGAFVEAENGTLFLDEIGELPLDAQPKLLRALDGYEVRRVGASGAGKRANVRVVAATHVPLEERVAAGTFRRDLFHRLEVFVIDVPPLRARPGDIAPIARQLLQGMSTEIGARELTSAALARLATHEWPGNVRELRNVLYRAADLARPGEAIDVREVDAGMRVKSGEPTLSFTPAMAKAWLLRHDNNLSAAARAAGYPRTTFRKLLKD